MSKTYAHNPESKRARVAQQFMEATAPKPIDRRRIALYGNPKHKTKGQDYGTA